MSVGCCSAAVTHLSGELNVTFFSVYIICNFCDLCCCTGLGSRDVEECSQTEILTSEFHIEEGREELTVWKNKHFSQNLLLQNHVGMCESLKNVELNILLLIYFVLFMPKAHF